MEGRLWVGGGLKMEGEIIQLRWLLLKRLNPCWSVQVITSHLGGASPSHLTHTHTHTLPPATPKPRSYTHTHIHTHTCTSTRTHTHRHTRTHAHTHTHTHTRTHTHTVTFGIQQPRWDRNVVGEGGGRKREEGEGRRGGEWRGKGMRCEGRKGRLEEEDEV